MDQLLLIGLDFGSTTSSAIISQAQVLRNCSTGRLELGRRSVVYRSMLTFTPFANDLIDEPGHGYQWRGPPVRWFVRGGEALSVCPRDLSNYGIVVLCRPFAQRPRYRPVD